MRPAPLRRTLLLIGAVAVIAGLFFMHGIGTHGAMPHGEMAATPPGAGAKAGSHDSAPRAGAESDMLGGASSGSMTLGSALPLEPRAGSSPGVLAMSDLWGNASGAMAMCLTILGVGLLMLLAAIRAKRHTGAIPMSARTQRLAAPKSRRRAPPSLTQLSIQRC